jgi:hypothetical protein
MFSVKLLLNYIYGADTIIARDIAGKVHMQKDTVTGLSIGGAPQKKEC